MDSWLFVIRGENLGIVVPGGKIGMKCLPENCVAKDNLENLALDILINLQCNFKILNLVSFVN